VLRERYAGKPEFVEDFFRFLAEEVRSYLAELGFRSLDEAIGHAEMLDTRKAIQHWKKVRWPAVKKTPRRKEERSSSSMKAD
jgi:hypothetical protein